MRRTETSIPFVLVHGAWAGGWAWGRVADRLHALGHQAYAPTLSGLGERSHLGPAGITLGTHVDDIVNELLWKDLTGVVLVGHSYGGFVITGVAERVLPRLAALVYVDAFIPEDQQSFADIASDWDFSGPVMPPPPTSPGDYRDEADRAWVDAKATPQPTGTFTERLRVSGAYQRVPSKTYIQATGWSGASGATASRLRGDPSWTVRDLPTGHDVAIDAPDELVRLLLDAAAGVGAPR